MVIDNYGPDVLERMGVGFEAMQQIRPGVLHRGIKGFLAGSCEKRNLLDEPAQMMGGLACMTGPPGMPLRAGAGTKTVTLEITGTRQGEAVNTSGTADVILPARILTEGRQRP